MESYSIIRIYERYIAKVPEALRHTCCHWQSPTGSLFSKGIAEVWMPVADRRTSFACVPEQFVLGNIRLAETPCSRPVFPGTIYP